MQHYGGTHFLAVLCFSGYDVLHSVHLQRHTLGFTCQKSH